MTDIKINENEHILIVEDEAIVAKDLQRKLQTIGYNVPDFVLTGEEAIEYVKENKPNLILMDIKLNGRLDGIETSEHIRSNYDIPIIFLTAYGDRTSIERAKLIEPNGYIMKPFNIQEVHSNIQLSLHKNKMENRLKNHHRLVVQILQSLGHAVITTDLNHFIKYLNLAAERITGFTKDQVIDKKIDDIIDIVDYKSNKKISIFDYKKDENKKTIDIDELVLISKKGKKTIIEYSLSPLGDEHKGIDGYVIILQDVTESRDGIRVLQKISKELERRVADRTKELQEKNIQLKNQIIERKRAEEKAKEAQISIENIINSTTEIIFSINRGNKIEYWNNSAEKITGYKKKDVFGKSIGKLSFFEDGKKVSTLIKNVQDQQKCFSDKLVIITKNYSKKVVHFSCSPIKIDKEINGFVFLGKDITYDWERHHNLLPGHSYLIPEKTSKSSIHTFSNFILSEYQGFYLTRAHPHLLQSRLSTDYININFIGKHSIDDIPTVETIKDFSETIQRFINTNNRGIILIDGLHYFITRFSFDEVTQALYEINEQIYGSNCILLLYLNPEIVHTEHIAILKSEFEPMPSTKVEDIRISDELSDILLYIKDESEKNSLVSLKKIISRFDIVYYTATKRVNQLIDEGLVFTKRYGKSRVVHLTEKAKSLLEKHDVH